MATLTVVMVLFFVMAMVAAYTNRNLIFEQRTSANSYRSAQALSAADAGIDWAVAMLNGGIIDENCQATAGATNDFRTRYLNLAVDGSFSLSKWPTASGSQAPRPSCTMTETGWMCGCPSGPAAQLPAASTAEAPVVFSVAMSESPNAYVTSPYPGTVPIEVKACTSALTGEVTDANVNNSAACHVRPFTQAADVDGQVRVQITLGLVSALPVPPVATLTAGGNITIDNGTTLSASNTDSSTGEVLHAGGSIVKIGTAAANLSGPAGTLGTGLDHAGDTALSNLATTGTGEALFQSVFGMAMADYRNQPAAIRLNCGGGCSSSADVAPVLANNPTRVLWIEGDLDINQAGALGSASAPVMIVVSGNLTISQAAIVTGVVYSHGNVVWAGSASNAAVIGALMARGNFTANANATLAYDRNVIRRLHQAYGSFVRVPGSWNSI